MPLGARSATCYPNLSFRLIDCGRFSAGHCLRRGDPFSHPSGSSAWQQVRAIHPPLNRKGGRKATPLRLVFVGTFRIPRALDFVKCPVLLFFSLVPVVHDLLSPAAIGPEPPGS